MALTEAIKKRASGGPYEAKYYCILVKPFYVAEVLTMG